MEVNIVSQGRHTATLNGNGVDSLETVKITTIFCIRGEYSKRKK